MVQAFALMSKQTPPTTKFQNRLKFAILNTRFLNFEQRFELWGVDFYKYCLLHWKRTQAALPLAARETPPLHPAGGGVDLQNILYRFFMPVFR